MDKFKIKKYICPSDFSLIDAMKLIDENSKGILYVTDQEGVLIGSITDGDIRRWILKTADLSANVSQFAFKNPRYIKETEILNADSFMMKEEIRSVPVVDEKMIVTDIIFSTMQKTVKHGLNSEALIHIPVIVMAGGKGSRLYPYTKILPKPLIPIGDIPILERILNRFNEFGAKSFYVTVNYKKEMIKSYFADQQLPYQIFYIEEEKPLGTAGSIRLIKEKFECPVIITNCDTLIEADYEKMLKYHMASNNDMTIISSLKNSLIPYGVLHTHENGIISSMEEKPQISYFINTGMYVLKPEFLKWIPEDKVFHMTDLADRMIENGKRVGMYPISENSFLDMGEFEELKKMEERINDGKIQ